MMRFVYRVPVRFHDVDAAGIVFFSRVFQYAHDAYEVWLRELGFPLEIPIAERGYMIPLARAEADFQSPLRAGCVLSVEIVSVRVGETSFTVRADLFGPDRTQHASVRTVHVCVDPATWRPRSLPEPFRQAIEAYLEGEAREGA